MADPDACLKADIEGFVKMLEIEYNDITSVQYADDGNSADVFYTNDEGDDFWLRLELM